MDKNLIKEVIIEMFKNGEIYIYIDSNTQADAIDLFVTVSHEGNVVHEETSRAYLD